ncbi:hypothetical protein EDB81DRAFT_784041 [Dactylonectria macrodidyma]|uniref:Ankyrin repeat protein n=1 Tax=Dactylonectria macrodidyma TaxID=307937 RepID=A0A9P9FGE1_9HYPO|nr:hypothetical protein EDB81DRAFT_784041 [Dactylonectria macrodidyma]
MQRASSFTATTCCRMNKAIYTSDLLQLFIRCVRPAYSPQTALYMLLYLAIFILSFTIMTNILPRSVFNSIRGMPPQGGARPPAPAKKDASFSPTPIDIVVARIMLTRGVKLPPDVVDMIFDHAEYWAHSSNEFNFKAEIQDQLRVVGNSPDNNKLVLRAYPVGLTELTDEDDKELAEVLAWDRNEAKPVPLDKEHEPDYFKKLLKYPTPKLIRPVRKVVFSIRSADQGWGGERGNRGTYQGSWTWFEAGLERFDADVTCDPQCTYDVRYKSASSKASPLPVCGLRAIHPKLEPVPNQRGKLQFKHPLSHNPDLEIYRNKTATREQRDTVVTWSYLDDIRSDSDAAEQIDMNEGRGRGTLDGSFVRDLKLGDVITIWAKSRFNGWVNHIESAQIDVYWAV